VPEPTVRETSAEHTRPLLAVFSATFFVRFAFGITVAVFASYISGHSTGLAQQDYGAVGVVSALAPAGEFLTVLFSGAAADRYGAFRVLFVGIAAAAVLFAAVATTRSPYVLGALNFVFGTSSGAILAASLAIVARRSGPDERGLEMGRFDAMNLLGWIGGFAFGFGLLDVVPNSSLDVVFLIGASALAAGLLLAVALVRGLPVQHGTRDFAFAPVLKHAFRRSVLLVTTPWFVIYMLIGTALVFLGSAAGGLGLSRVYLAAAIGGGGLILVVTQPFFGRLSDRTGRMRMMTVGATGFVLVMTFASLIIAWGAQIPLLVGIGASVLAALAYGPAALAALADLTTEMGRATTMAIYSLTISSGMVVGLAVSTTLYSDLGDLGIYVFFALISAALVALTVARYRDVTTPPTTVDVTTPAR
jgi:MFS family permease